MLPFRPRPLPRKPLSQTTAAPIGLIGGVGDREENDPADLSQLARALGRLGDYRPEDYGRTHDEPAVWDGAPVGALARFQEREGLKVDALARPGGPTERRLEERLLEQEEREARRARPLSAGERAALDALDGTARERLLREAGFTYQPDPFGRLGQGDWRDRNGRVQPPSTLGAVLREQLAFNDKDGDGSDSPSSNAAAPQMRRARGQMRRNENKKPEKDAGETTASHESVPSIGGTKTGKYSETDEDVKQRAIQRIADWRSKGRTTAAENLEHFIKGTGESKIYSRSEARAFEPIRAQEKKIRGYIMERSFTGKVKANLELKRKLKSLVGAPEGTSTIITDAWDGRVLLPQHIWQSLKDNGDFKLAFGDTNVRGLVALRATKRENSIEFEGAVTYNWHDIYDFEIGGLGSADMLRLQRTLGAKPYMIDSAWQQRVIGRVDIKNGRLVRPRAAWYDLPESADR